MDGLDQADCEKLAIELATRFNGEIINTDAMQLYKGLPIITNKIPEHERKGIPHHLLDHIGLGEPAWTVDVFKREAERTIEAIRGRGKLPILVGGTQYYVNPLLFPEVTLDEVQGEPSQSFPILKSPTAEILAELKRVDPVMAERWHPNDRRKISRSLEIYLQTGKPASEFYAEQQKRKDAALETGETAGWENLLFWVYAEREPLKNRLDNRVDKMVEGGLLQEVQQMRSAEHRIRGAGDELDLTKGIWQSIGYKQFEPYQVALAEGRDAEEVLRLKEAALEDMKTATRRYANYQTKWVRTKQLPLLAAQGPTALGCLYLLDSTNVAHFQENVVGPAAKLTEQFLNGLPRQSPQELSALAREVLTEASEPSPKQVFAQRTCEICRTVLVTEQAWQQHVRGTAHKRVLKKKKKLALVAVEGPKAVPAEGEDNMFSEPDMTGLGELLEPEKKS